MSSKTVTAPGRMECYSTHLIIFGKQYFNNFSKTSNGLDPNNKDNPH